MADATASANAPTPLAAERAATARLGGRTMGRQAVKVVDIFLCLFFFVRMPDLRFLNCSSECVDTYFEESH